MLRDYCLADDSTLLGLQKGANPTGRYRFIDRSGRILAVAHVDSVYPVPQYNTVRADNDLVIVSPRLDNRVGVWIVMEVLPRLGVKADVLLTYDEEACNSSAAKFIGKKRYNWLVEFDRTGRIPALYQYLDIPAWREAVANIWGDEPVRGSYTDIVDMEHLGICGLNVGVGYVRQHSMTASTTASDIHYALSKFIAFWRRYGDQCFPYSPRRRR